MHIEGNFGIEVPGGLAIYTFFGTDAELIDGIWAGQKLPGDEYDQIDIYVKPNLRADVIDVLKNWKDIDLNKINFVDKPQTSKDASFELIYKKTDKNVTEIE